MPATTIASYGRNGQKDVCFSRMLKNPASLSCSFGLSRPGAPDRPETGQTGSGGWFLET